MRESKGKAVVVGGSIAGVCAVQSLLSAGWEVVVLEKTTAPPTGSPTGAGNQAIDAEKKMSRILTRDESFNFRAAHWSDLHGLLYNALPPDIFLWGHVFQSFCVSDEKKSVKVQTKVLQTGNIVEFACDLLVAADGCLSSIRRAFFPDLKLRYSGYSAWRGVLDLSGDENSDIFAGLQKVYQDLGKCLYFDLGSGTHAVLYELLNKKINWICNYESKQQYDQENARATWCEEHKHDSDPLHQIVWDRVVLIGDAAHPTTPHGVRSTDMAILDAAVPVLHSRKMGRMKQGLVLADGKVFDPITATPQECKDLQQKCMPGFNNVP
ncbi:hypothetical protein L1987_59383 [Smallanthus sonchifolius]|uniref:Uncharacterized protein n=1 Tax=Smallanthus sonchifolius TaxID=185202 RepID=A0ACB9D548_9ASTR|nr:hypothetical protein L1987_59383 [Smallanthus sonchifolius]